MAGDTNSKFDHDPSGHADETVLELDPLLFTEDGEELLLQLLEPHEETQANGPGAMPPDMFDPRDLVADFDAGHSAPESPAVQHEGEPAAGPLSVQQPEAPGLDPGGASLGVLVIVDDGSGGETPSTIV